MLATSKITISRKALKSNYRFIREQIGGDAKISWVVKGNAYGHGIEVFIPMAEACGADHFSVFDASEAYRVKKSLINQQAPIMIMGMVEDQHLEWAIENDIEFYVFEPERLAAAVQAAKKVGKKAKVHVEAETGMNRIGYEAHELEGVAEQLKHHPDALQFQGLCTHFAGAESIANYVRVTQQRKTYKRILNWFANQGLQPRIKHIACSAAAMRYPPTRLDMVRIGILQYGFWPSRETLIEHNSKVNRQDNPLERLISWKSQVMDTKTVKTGEYVGYGTSYMATQEMKVATIPIGYGHGFARSLSNAGRVLIHGKRVGVIGTVNMNAITVDISPVEGVKRGDEVVIIGNQGDLELSVSAFGEFSQQVNYELLTRLPMDIPREVVD
ncbi:MAG: alanine racemase [Phaeodactylibacter sp.]|uniref:alanine racemase n=1 Tax=Phaeodactylibacter sp. TaxID=1940289 RepID=UPI0032EE8107